MKAALLVVLTLIALVVLAGCVTPDPFHVHTHLHDGHVHTHEHVDLRGLVEQH